MLSRIDLLKLEFIYRVIHTHDKKLFLELNQVNNVFLEYQEDIEENWLDYPPSNYDHFDLQDVKAYAQTLAYNYSLNERKELSSNDIELLFRQADAEMTKE